MLLPLTICSVLLWCSVSALPHQDISKAANDIQEDKKPGESSARALVKDCATDMFNPTCLKIGAISFLDKLNSKEELQLFPGVSVVREGKESTKDDEVAADIARAYPGKPEERLGKYLLHKVSSYLDTHSVKLRLLDDQTAEEVEANAVGGARKQSGLGGGKKGGMDGLMMAAMMMKGMMMTMGMGGLAMMAGKAMMLSMLSMMLSAIMGLKSMTGGGKSTTYEIVTKPVYSHAHSHSASHVHEDAPHGGGGWGRSFEEKKIR